jgi:hypothetical protein
MIHYNNLYITEDSKCLIIDVAIDEESYYENIYLDKIAIDTQDTYVPNGPSDKAKIFTIRKESLDKVYADGKEIYVDDHYIYVQDTDKLKHIKLYLTTQDLEVNLSKDMLFVYTIATGTPAPNTPCNCDVNKILSIVYNDYEVYKSIIPLVKEISNECNNSVAFINKELQLKAIEYAIKSGNYLLAIKYWRKYFMNNINIVSKKCNCNGST